MLIIDVVRYQREPFSKDLISEMLPIFEEHYQEIAHFKDIKLDPDFGVYEALANAGALRICTARQDGHLCGYIVFIVRRNPHYRQSLQAVQDILYLSPPMRQGLTGYRFIKWCDDRLRDEGVQAVYHHVKVQKDFGRVLERLGYFEVDKIYTRRLDAVKEV